MTGSHDPVVFYFTPRRFFAVDLRFYGSPRTSTRIVRKKHSFSMDEQEQYELQEFACKFLKGV